MELKEGTKWKWSCSTLVHKFKIIMIIYNVKSKVTPVPESEEIACSTRHEENDVRL